MKLKDIESLNFRPGEWWNQAYFEVQSFQEKQTWHLRGDAYVTALISSRLFSREACVFCPDFTARMADMAFGGGRHSKFENNLDGYNFGIIRTEAAAVIIKEMEKKLLVTIEHSSPKEFIASQLYGNLLYKQLRIRNRLSYLMIKDKHAMVNTNELYSLSKHARLIFYFKLKDISENLEYLAILHRMPGIAYKIALIERRVLREEDTFKVFKALIGKYKRYLKYLKTVRKKLSKKAKHSLAVWKRLFKGK